MLDCCQAIGIHTVTAFAFSLDNFKRSKQEVDDLLNLAAEKLSHHIPEIVAKTRVRVFGDTTTLPVELQALLAKAVFTAEFSPNPNKGERIRAHQVTDTKSCVFLHIHK